MNKTKIEWADYSWNPIKGLCPEACWYCYARAMCRRFKREQEPRLDGYALRDPVTITAANLWKRVFVCSTFELFNPIADKWRDKIFSHIEHYRDLTFIILTKRPERIDRPMPDNVWLGVSVTRPDDLWRWFNIDQLQKARVKFISFEPILEPFNKLDLGYQMLKADWVIAGRLTGRGHQHDPSISTLNNIIGMSKAPVFLKNNLKGIWPGPLMQEFPK